MRYSTRLTCSWSLHRDRPVKILTWEIVRHGVGDVDEMLRLDGVQAEVVHPLPVDGVEHVQSLNKMSFHKEFFTKLSSGEQND